LDFRISLSDEITFFYILVRSDWLIFYIQN
jgi:hypothetical protein